LTSLQFPLRASAAFFVLKIWERLLLLFPDRFYRRLIAEFWQISLQKIKNKKDTVCPLDRCGLSGPL